MAQNPRTARVGFAGLGAMGLPMATNMVKKGIDVIAFDLNEHALEKFSLTGGLKAENLQAASVNSSKFFIMVATPDQADSLIFGFGDSRLSKTLPQNAILCLFSTLPPDYVTRLKGRLPAIGRPDIRLLDAPVSGGAVGAQKGTLSIMLGGSREDVQAIQGELEAISAPGRLFHCGDVGAASMVKMLNQHLAGIHIVAAAEMLAFAKANGLSPRQTYNIIKSSEASSWIFGDRGASMIVANWTPRSAVTIFTKDLAIVTEAADSASCPCPLAAVAQQAFLERAARGHGRDDDASVVCNYEDIIGKRVCNEARTDQTPSTPPGETTLDGLNCKRSVFVTDKQPSDSSCLDIQTLGEFRSSVDLSQSSSTEPLLILWDTTTPESWVSLEKCSPYIPKGSFVSVVGLGDPSEVPSRIGLLASKHPHLQFLDAQIIPSSVVETKKDFLFTAQDNQISRAIEGALPPGIIARPVIGQLGAATATFLTIRLGSLIHVAAAAECCRLAMAKGVSAQLVYDLIAGAAGSSHQFNVMFPSMLREDFVSKNQSSTALMSQAMQDLMTLERTCRQLQFPSRLLSSAHQIFKSVNARRLGSDTSVSSLVRFWDVK